MATKTYLTKEQLISATDHLSVLRGKINDPESTSLINFGKQYSNWLGEQLLARLSASKYWGPSLPIVVGSWARGELCPCSDIDLIFCGPEDQVKHLVDDIHSQGLKLRYRVPEDINDWSVGVGSFDVTAILQALPFSIEAGALLAQQQEMIINKGQAFSSKLINDMLLEREQRSLRYDSISSYLEPNVKYGPGGLRDLQQALYICELFSVRFPDVYTLVKKLESFKWFFICIRHWVHINAGTDLLNATVQKELSEFCGFDSVIDFNKYFHKTLSEVSFYADWIVERAKISVTQISKIEELNIKSFSGCFKVLSSNSGILFQGKVRLFLDQPSLKKPTRRAMGQLMAQYFVPEQSEEFIVSLFRSKLINEVVPEINRVQGLVQHDQYHRYTVDAHTLQALRSFIRGVKKPSSVFGSLGVFVKKLSALDKKIIMWTCLYHDLAKGQPGSHSDLGSKLVLKNLTDFGLPKKLLDEVQWLVENHLILSAAAFKHNPKAASTWQYLHKKGINKSRLIKLALFTVIDIQATNPDAWTDWKERLLNELVIALQSKGADQFMELLTQARDKKVELSEDFVKGLDPTLVENVSVALLLDDYKRLKTTKVNLPVRFFRVSEDEHWVRFHSLKDKPGIFLKFVSALYASGCKIHQCSVQSFKPFGVYDWFLVKTNKTPTQLKKIIPLVSIEPETVPDVKFEVIEIVSETDAEVLISFRGKRIRGFWFVAAKSLFDHNLTIYWAKVNTWGRQVEGVFSVENNATFTKDFKNLRSEYSLKV